MPRRRPDDAGLRNPGGPNGQYHPLMEYVDEAVILDSFTRDLHGGNSLQAKECDQASDKPPVRPVKPETAPEAAAAAKEAAQLAAMKAAAAAAVARIEAEAKAQAEAAKKKETADQDAEAKKSKQDQAAPDAADPPENKKKKKNAKKGAKLTEFERKIFLQLREVKRSRRDLGKLTQLMQMQRHHERLQRHYEQTAVRRSSALTPITPASKAMKKNERAVLQLKRRLRLPDSIDRFQVEDLLQARAKMTKKEQERVQREELERKEHDRQLKAAAKVRRQERKGQQQQEQEQAEAQLKASQPRKHKFLGDHLSISVVRVGGSKDAEGICTSEVDGQQYIRTSHRFRVGDWVLGARDKQQDEPKVFVDLPIQSADVKEKKGWDRVVRMDVQGGSRLNAYDLRKALKHGEIEATDQGHNSLKDNALMLHFSIDVLCVRSNIEHRTRDLLDFEEYQEQQRLLEEARQKEEEEANRQQQGVQAQHQKPADAEQPKPRKPQLVQLPVPARPDSLHQDVAELLHGTGRLGSAAALFLKPDILLHVTHRDGSTKAILDERKFEVHSFLVEGRTDFFQGMLNWHVAQGGHAQDVVTIHEAAEPAIVDAVLHWMYTDELPSAWHVPSLSRSEKAAGHLKLLALACRWHVRPLMRMAARALCQHMTPETAAYALALAEGSHPQLKLPNEPAPERCPYAEMDEFQRLKDFALHFIAMTLSESTKPDNPGWAYLCSTRTYQQLLGCLHHVIPVSVRLSAAYQAFSARHPAPPAAAPLPDVQAFL